MTESVFILGIALGILLGLVVGVAVTALVMVSVDEADKAAAYYYGLLKREVDDDRYGSADLSEAGRGDARSGHDRSAE